MVKILKKLDTSLKLKISKNISSKFIKENLVLDVQATIVPCPIEHSLINNIPYKLIFKEDDFFKINGEEVIYSEEEINTILSSKELKNIILKELVNNMLK